MKRRIEVIKGDITGIEVDIIVNAANSRLIGGGGVDGAIHRVGGPEIMQECDKIRASEGGCPTGSAVITIAGKLPAKYVIHAVGPVWYGGKQNEPKLLADAYKTSLDLATSVKTLTIAFPNISTGIYGYPKTKAAEIAINTVIQYLLSHTYPKKVIFVCFDDDSLLIYRNKLKEL
jgi:O-acetyl-ADP-ribose deacetylase (regulator of RNase III)